MAMDARSVGALIRLRRNWPAADSETRDFESTWHLRSKILILLLMRHRQRRHRVPALEVYDLGG